MNVINIKLDEIVILKMASLNLLLVELFILLLLQPSLQEYSEKEFVLEYKIMSEIFNTSNL